MTNSKDEYKLLYARAEDLFEKSKKGVVSASSFLNPAEAHYLEKYARETGRRREVILWGGYNGAERVKFFFLPDYIDDMVDMSLDENEKTAFIFSCIADDIQEEISAVKIERSGYRKLTHRDYLGSLLSLGIERFVIGDIVVQDDKSAVVFVDGKIFPYITENLQKIANDEVKVSAFSPSEDFKAPKNYEESTDSVASLRADCVVASLANCSRTEAQKLVSAGNVALEYEEISEFDKPIVSGSIISVRGYGKFRVYSDGSTTKSGRIKIKIQKYL